MRFYYYKMLYNNKILQLFDVFVRTILKKYKNNSKMEVLKKWEL